MNAATQGIAWNDGYKLGNETIDSQHKKLFDLVGGLVESCIDGSETERLNERLDFLADYTVRHFDHEEQWQQECGYPGYEGHKQIHEEFKAAVSELVSRFKENGSSVELSDEMNKTVIRWLINHILKEDMKIGEHIRSKHG